MGTRNLVAVVVDGVHRVAQYGQWDGYPSGQGQTVCRFIQSMTPDKRRRFLTNLRASRFLSEVEIAETWKECGANSEWVSLEISRRHREKYPALSRDTGAGILSLISDTPQAMADSWPFGGDSLFCEFAYVLDVDNDVLEFYQGFQKKDHQDGRFAGLPSRDGYRPCRMVAAYPFSTVTDATPADMDTRCERSE